ncbi:MAG TPA: NADPH-dependent glutamate synthase [Bacillota bacterium]|jgi:glutamate synthase (NADPH/NADH) small chain
MPIKPRTSMPTQEAEARKRNFNEVALGYREEDAIAEAARCLQCKDAPCQKGCPVGVQIKDFIKAAKTGDWAAAYDKIKETNSLPAVCGRVCPQEEQCEKLCLLGKKGQPEAIGRLERYASDMAMKRGVNVQKPGDGAPGKGRKVAIVGSGPAGLTAAGDLAKLGYSVTIFEALHASGGVLIYGIPEFRLPKAIVAEEVDLLKKLGVEVRTDVIIGRTVTVDEVFAMGYEAVFLGTGAGLPKFMGIPGENLNGIYSANEYLTRTNLMKAYRFPDYDTPIKMGKKVAVIGAGNVAMDSVRSALRHGADEAFVVYRRTEKEMTARAEEFEHAIEEGVKFHFLTNPVKFLGDETGWVKGMEVQKMELGEPDASGRARPVPIPNSNYVMECDTVVVALGTSPNPLLSSTTPGLKTKEWGGLIVEEETGKTTRDAVYAGGDAVTGSATVILAMGAGKKAAKAIHEDLQERAKKA